MFYKLFNLQCYNIINKIYCNTFLNIFFIFLKNFYTGGIHYFFREKRISPRTPLYQRSHEPFFKSNKKEIFLSLFIQSNFSAFIIIYPVLLIRVQIAFFKLHYASLKVVRPIFIQPFSSPSLNSNHLLDVSVSSILNRLGLTDVDDIGVTF